MPERVLLKENAEAILDGLLVVAFITGADMVVVGLNEIDTETPEYIKKASEYLQKSDGFKGKPTISFRTLPDRLVVLEETAFLNALDGNSPVTYYRNENNLSFADGIALSERTNILFHVHLAMCKIKPDEGTRLITILGDVLHPGVAEVYGTTTFRELVELAGGAAEGKNVKVLLFGGPGGRVISADGLDQTLGGYAFEKDMLDTGELLVYDDSECIVDFAGGKFDTLRRESCGRCVFCREGCRQLSMILKDFATAKAVFSDMEHLDILSGCAAEAAECSLGRSAGRMLGDILDSFKPEFESHIRRRCPASVCKGFISYHILPLQCDGCNLCLNACPNKAISGEVDEIHVIDKFDCDRCGLCVGACPQGAIVKAGAVKPKTPTEPIPVGTWRR